MTDNNDSSSPSNDITNAVPSQPPKIPETEQKSEPTTTSSATTTTSTPTPPTSLPAAEDPLREDLLKPAVSFLSSPNVRSADTAKKIAFLKNKGLNKREIDEAFRRVGQSSTVAETPTQTTTQATYVPPPSAAPLIPARPVVHASTAPQIIYYPVIPPSMSVERVLATAMIVGLGAVGVTAGLIGIIRHFMNPIFTRVALFRRKRYNERREVADKVKEKFEEEDDSLKSLSQEHKKLVDSLERMVAQARAVGDRKNTPYRDFQTAMADLRHTVSEPAVYSTFTSFNRSPSDSGSPTVQAFKSEIRSLKGALLNRRNFPVA
ncbi:peroxisomal membrane protein pex14 [Apophysomyces ossiformis]|uniref:Peroxisomal membrane protein PEX14 n=1 Tax=Apophysomyces ossiformis TaxID=679940 RepID=A0A8H7EMS2_9FUNG|nr:peroxisomal membrane protein pex14 [Apophysomyces ossiformis]